MHELGSEFWNTSEFKMDTIEDSYNRNLLSGRTAIDYIIKDIKLTRNIRSILVPSYVCESMIEPMLRNNISLSFYNPYEINNLDIKSEDVDAILIIDYFGYQRLDWRKVLDTVDESKAIIYDSTHSLLGNKSIESRLDYSFISYRKWYFTNHCIVRKYKKEFDLKQPVNTNIEYIRLRKIASENKKKYIEQNIGDKDNYLRIFRRAESILESDYIGYKGIPEIAPLNKIVNKRRENAQYLIDRLKNISNIELMHNSIEEYDIPLFVPIIVHTNRDKLRIKLINNKIYCPVHWPISKLHEDYLLNNNIYNSELSLICDQRYNLEDMERQVDVIEEFSSEMKW